MDRPGDRKFASYNLPEWVRHPQKGPIENAAVLFPGEQNHYVGMLKDAKAKPVVQDMLLKASGILGCDMEDLCANGPASKMEETGFAQPLAYVANQAAFEQFAEGNPQLAQHLKGVAGFSVGELNALVVAGVITFDQGLHLVKQRAESLQALSMEIDMEALVVQGLDFAKLEKACNNARQQDGSEDPQVAIAQAWGSDSFTCAGRKSTVLRLQELLKSDRKVKDARLLPGHVHAAHTLLVAKAAAQVNDAIDRLIPSMKPPKCALYLNVGGTRVSPGSHPATFAHLLKEQLTTLVQWEILIHQMLRWGTLKFYECGPGKSIRGMLADYQFEIECPHQQINVVDGVTNISV